MKDKKIMIISSLVILLLITFITVMIIIPKDKILENEGFKIKVPSNFSIKKSTNLHTYIYSKDVKIGVRKDKLSNIKDEVINEQSSLQEYASRIARINEINVKELYKLEKTNYIYYTYYKNNYIYISLFAKEAGAFWNVYFIEKEENKDELFENFKKWGKTIKFN